MTSLTPVQHEPAVSGSKPPAGRPATPPQWLLERAIAWLGRGPKAVGRFLDRLAAHEGPIGWVVRFFSTIPLGLTWLFLTATYIALGSGLPSLHKTGRNHAAIFRCATHDYFDGAIGADADYGHASPD